MGNHTTVTVTNPFTNESVEVDTGIVDLIVALWQRGLQTKFCCEGYDDEEDVGDAYIYFNDATHAMRFGQMVINNGTPELRLWARGGREHSTHFFFQGELEQLSPEEIEAKQKLIDAEQIERLDHWSYSMDFFEGRFRCSIYFPKSQILEILMAVNKCGF